MMTKKEEKALRKQRKFEWDKTVFMQNTKPWTFVEDGKLPTEETGTCELIGLGWQSTGYLNEDGCTWWVFYVSDKVLKEFPVLAWKTAIGGYDERLNG